MVKINKAQAQTLALLTRDAPLGETWEVEETNMESVVCLREYRVEDEHRDVLIAADGQAVALGQGGDQPTVLLTSDGPPTG